VSKVCRDLLVPRETLASKNGKAAKRREKRGNDGTKTGLNHGTVIAPECVEQPILSSPAAMG
jgi:hypothetical protein